MTHRSNEQLDAETAAINTETIAAGKWKMPAVNSELLALESILWDANLAEISRKVSPVSQATKMVIRASIVCSRELYFSW